MSPLEILFLPLGWALRGKRADAGLSVARAPELATENRLELTSDAFRDGEVIPAKHCGFGIGDNVSPALHWSKPPDGTRTLLLVIEDLDTPTKRPAIHTAALFDATTATLAEGELTPDNQRFRYLPNHRGRTGYIGPRPLPGHGPHHYQFLSLIL
ncbi:YbhB/YbcL family Raf kinase inhibitor-like protein, partial [Amycolatopsis pithecellobii]